MNISGNFFLVFALLAAGCGASAQPAAQPKRGAASSIHLEAEDAHLEGPGVSTELAGFSGRGYVSGFEKDGAKITWSIAGAHAGVYQVRLRYAAPSGEKGYDLSVNGSRISGMFPESKAFATREAGKVELKEGANEISIEKGWGYYFIDALDLVPVQVQAGLKKPPLQPADAQATAQARALLKSLGRDYGSKTLSGQYEQADNDLVLARTGQTPAIRGGDLMEYSPTRLAFGSKPEGTVEKLIQNARAGQIITLSWHWNAPSGLINTTYTNAQGKKIEAPWWRGFYTDASTFDLKQALDNPQSQDYKYLLRDIDAIAIQLKKFQDSNIPILWRPLHEAEGGWFWWGAKGPEPFKKLWRLMFERLTKTHGLHNLIWVDSSGLKPEWYPGDDVVDIVGIDAYPSDVSDPLSPTWDELLARYNSRKLLALTEFGGVPDVDKAARFGVRWSYFVSWTGDLGPAKMSPQVLERIYKSPRVLNLQALKPSAPHTP